MGNSLPASFSAGHLSPDSNATGGRGDWTSGNMYIAVWALRGLRMKGAASDSAGRINLSPYVIAKLHEIEHRTPTLCYGFEQTWHEDNIFMFKLGAEDGVLQIQVMNAHVAEDEVLACLAIDLQDIWRLDTGKWHQRAERLHGRTHGVVEFALHVEPTSKAGTPQS